MKTFYFFILILLFFNSCSKDAENIKNKAILTENTWVLKGYQSSNSQVTSISDCCLYLFDNENNYQKNTCEGAQISSGTWQFIQSNEYINIDNISYKIIYLSEKIMTLRYGNVEMSFLPI